MTCRCPCVRFRTSLLPIVRREAGASRAALVAAARAHAGPLRFLPEPLLRLGSLQLIEQVLAVPLERGRLDEFVGRRIGVEATDLGLRWVVSIGDRRVEVLEPRFGTGLEKSK